MEFAPGAFNIVPAHVDVSLEFRSPDDDEFKLDSALIEAAQEKPNALVWNWKQNFLGVHSPSIMNENIKRAISDACDTLGLTYISLVSGAGHDGQSLTNICPVGMIFVPSVDGASHAPRELTHWEDCVNGANVLLQAVLRLTG